MRWFGPGFGRDRTGGAALQAGSDEALLEPEMEVVVLVGHLPGARLLERDPSCHTGQAESAKR